CLSLLVIFCLFKKLTARSLSEWIKLLPQITHPRFFVPAAAFFGTLIFMTKSGLSCPARYLGPFYTFLLAPVLAGFSLTPVLRNVFWKRFGNLVFGVSGLLLVISPARPLWPALTVLTPINAEQSSRPFWQRAWT